MSRQSYPITGIQTGKGGNGAVPIRQEIDSWYSQRSQDSVQKQIDLFLLGLKRFQEIDPTDKLSYFGVTGIHGQPLIPWDEVVGRDINPAITSEGYCNHNSTLFGTWHRPYLALYEQRIYECMLEVAAQYPASQQQTYKHLADTWRLPYWDWAVTNDVPQLVKLQQVQVTGPKGKTVINNPLFKYSSVDKSGKPIPMGKIGITGLDFPGTYLPYQICQATSRYPPDYPKGTHNQGIINAWTSGVEGNSQVASALQEDADFGSSSPVTLKEWVYRLFSGVPDWDGFSTTLDTQLRASNNVSLEGVHNAIHDYCGGLGHMGQVPVAAFDPIFWLHHCNVDRILAIWQTLNPDSWFADPQDQLPDPGSYYVQRLEVPTPQTKLHPFHKDKNYTLYTSDDIRDWKVLGYSYTELQPWNYPNNNDYLTSVLQAVNNLYSATRNIFLGRPQLGLPSQGSAGQQFISAAAIPPTVQAGAGADQPQVPTEQPADVAHHDYLVSVVYSRFDYDSGAPYRIYIFLGSQAETVDQPAESWKHSKYLAGTIYNFSTKVENTGVSSHGCGSCKSQQKQKLLSVGQIPITHNLVQIFESAGGTADDLHPDLVKRYLQENLHWGATTLNGHKIELTDLPSLKVYVSSGIARHFTDDTRLSEFNDFEIHRDVTHGRVGGLSHA